MIHPSQLDFPDSPFSRAAANPLMLGIMPPLKGDSSHSSNPWDFDYNLRIVRLAEQIGFDVAMSSAQWSSHPMMENGNSLDAFITPMVMAGATSRIILISTLHMLYGNPHPLQLAKFAATMDHIAKGRWGLNAITGNALGEFSMFGQPRPDHGTRFEKTAELINVMHGLWGATEPGLTHIPTHGEWSVNDAWVSPKPLYGRPIMVSAGGSDDAIDFFATHSDVLFTASPSAVHIDANLRALPAFTSRIKASHPKGKIWITPCIASRPTMDATIAYISDYHARANPVQLTSSQMAHYQSDSQSWTARQPDMVNYPRPVGIGGSCELYGPPDVIAEQLVKLHASGVDGVMLKFLDYERDCEYFGERIMPLLIKAGVRLDETPPSPE